MAGTAVGGGTTGVIVGAVATTGATKGTVSAINNQGDLGEVFKDVTSKESLKDYVVAGGTAGLTSSLFDKLFGTETNPFTDKVNNVDLGALEGVGNFAGNQLAQSGTAAALNQLMGRDPSFKDALQSALYNTLAAAAFNAVGDYTEGKLPDGSPQKVAIHAIVGGLLSEATGGDFKTGAIAAGANEALVVQLDALVKNDPALLTMSSQLVGLIAAAAVDGDIEKGAWVAQNATQYNYLDHSDSKDFEASMKECGSDESCQRKKWEDAASGFGQLSQANFDEALATGGAVWAKDQMGRIAAGLDVLGSMSCATTTCESYKFTLIDRALTSYARLADVVGEWEPILGVIGGVAAGVAGSRPGSSTTRPEGSNPTVGSAQFKKAYEYWAKVKAEGGPKATGAAGDSAGAMRRLDYEAAPYHGKVDNAVKSRAPINGQDALDTSIQVKPTSPRRVGVDYESKEFVVFDKTLDTTYHGHVRSWKDLHPDMQKALQQAGMADRKGNILVGGKQ
ncbi:hypothetical protein D9M70_424020 [compost metagenome]